MNPALSPPRLLPAVGGRAPWLSLAVIALSFIAALDMIGVAAGLRALSAWPQRLAGSVTVAAAGRGLEGADASAARTLELLTRAGGVSRAWALDPDPADALAARIMGLKNAGPDGVPPRLLGAAFDAGSPASPGQVAALLRRARINAAVDDHGLWSGPLERVALLAAAAAAALVLIPLAAVFALIAWGVRRGFARLRGRITLLVHLGAPDGQIAGPFSRRLALTAVISACLGVAAAAGAALAVSGSSAAAAWLKSQGMAGLALDGWDYAAGLIWLAIACPLGAWAAASAARSSLRRLS